MNPPPKITRLPKPVSLSLIVAMVFLSLAAVYAPFTQIAPVKSLDTFFYDRFMIQARPKSPSYTHDVTIIDIDEVSLAGAGQWPWPRYRLAQMLSRKPSDFCQTATPLPPASTATWGELPSPV